MIRYGADMIQYAQRLDTSFHLLIGEKGEVYRLQKQKQHILSIKQPAISFEWDRAGGVYNFGTILVLDPPHRLSYTWEAMEPSPTAVTFELSPENDGTRLHLIHSGIGESKEWNRYYTLRDNGWNIHLEHLVAWLETGICPSPGPIKRPS